MRPIAFLALWLALPLAAAPKSGFITTSDGVRLHYLEAGKGPAIVFVPGWTMPAEIWEAQIDHFSKGHRVVALDPRSQGESQQVNEGHYPERRSQDVKDLVDQLKLAPAVLVGWSLAVPELLEYAKQFGTSGVRALVLVDGGVGSDPDPKMQAGISAMLLAVQKSRAVFTTGFVRQMYRKPRPEAYFARITEASLKTPTNTAVTLLANVFFGGDWRPVLAKLDCPVLYAGTPQSKQTMDVVQSLLPSARIEVFEDAGHALFVDDAERFNRVVGEFLSGLSAKK